MCTLYKIVGDEYQIVTVAMGAVKQLQELGWHISSAYGVYGCIS